jgi:hypothetical protein
MRIKKTESMKLYQRDDLASYFFLDFSVTGT